MNHYLVSYILWCLQNINQVNNALNILNEEINNNSNLVPHIIACIKSNCTLGEICNVLKNNYGEHN